MQVTPRELESLRAVIERISDAPSRELHLRHQRLRGGLEASSVARIVAGYRDRHGRRCTVSLVMKRVAGAASREALLYERLVVPRAGEFAPRLLGVDRTGSGRATLYLEAVTRARAWPWRSTAASLSVLASIARLHAASPAAAALHALRAWDYDTELLRVARSTADRLDALRRHPELRFLAAPRRAARRLVENLSELRRELLGFAPLGATAIHGDLHPGNAVLRRDASQVVLLDWGRARIGSPLEDVSSWLLSLGGWEPEVRRRHDTLFGGYLSARGLDRRLTPPLRGAYWLAGASNALSGALLHHLTVTSDSRATPRQRAVAARAAFGWGRVLRRAAAWWA
jgi:hypothetical protein